MRVLITPRLKIDPVLGNLWALEEHLLTAFEKLGCEIIVAPPQKLTGTLLQNVSHVVFSGGNDVENPPSLRDRFEYSLLRECERLKVPALGICRGMQAMNVHFGGSLVYDLRQQIKSEHVRTHHKVTLKHEPLAKKLGRSEVMVNSYHNHGISSDGLSPKLKGFGYTDQNQTVEGMFHPTLPLVGIMWHPERDSQETDINSVLLEAFLKRELFWEKK